MLVVVGSCMDHGVWAEAAGAAGTEGPAGTGYGAVVAGAAGQAAAARVVEGVLPRVI